MKTVCLTLGLLLVLALVVFLYDALYVPDDNEQTLVNASWHLQDYLKYSLNQSSLLDSLEGPVISVDRHEYLEVYWFRVLDWGDTAKIFARQYKSPMACTECKTLFSRIQEYFEPTFYMNYSWTYLDGPRSSFYDLFDSRRHLIFQSSYIRQRSDAIDTIQIRLLVSENKFETILVDGFFEVKTNNDELAVLEFFEPIAQLIAPNGFDTVATRFVSVTKQRDSTLVIQPIRFTYGSN